MKTKWPMAGGRRPAERRNNCPGACPGGLRPSRIASGRGFTLIELLVVIAIIGVIAGFTIPALDAVKKRQAISHTQAEMAQLQAALDSYHAAYGYYPPGNPGNPLVNQLYYELEGTTYNNNAGASSFSVINNPGDQLGAAQIQSVFGAGGFMNSSKPGSGEDTPVGRNFIGGLRPTQTAVYKTNGVQITILIGSVGGPDTSYQPLGTQDVNPWRYVCPGVNNPNGYDLWMQLSIFGTKYRICNWSKTIQVNSPDQ